MTTCPICGSAGYEGLRSFECERVSCQNFAVRFSKPDDPTRSSFAASPSDPLSKFHAPVLPGTGEPAKRNVYDFPVMLSLEDGRGPNHPDFHGVAFALNAMEPSRQERVASLTREVGDILRESGDLHMSTECAREFGIEEPALTRDADGTVWVNHSAGQDAFRLEDWDHMPDCAAVKNCKTGMEIGYGFYSEAARMFTQAERDHAQLVSRARVAEKRVEDMAKRHHRIVEASGYDHGGCAYVLDAATNFIIAKLKGTKTP